MIRVMAESLEFLGWLQGSPLSGDLWKVFEYEFEYEFVGCPVSLQGGGSLQLGEGW
jgi:hypothetical protein